MPYLALTNTYPGDWGRGNTWKEAIANCRAVGGKRPGTLLEIDDAYIDPYIDQMGGLQAHASDETLTVPRDEWPPVVKAQWRLGPRGAKTPVTK